MVASPLTDVRPLVVTCGGIVLDVLLMNKRSYIKTRESRELWVTDASGNRDLPYRTQRGQSSQIARLQRGDSWYAAALTDDTSRDERIKYNSGPNSARPTGQDSNDALTNLAATIRERKEANPDSSYTAYLFEQGMDKIRKKVGEEAIEVITAASAEDLVAESADLLYHLLALLEVQGVCLDQVYTELNRRQR